MAFYAVTHITVSVPVPLREAEAYYAWLFGLEVSWREPVPEGAPFDVGWDALDAAGVRPEIAMLHSGEFRLAVTGSDSRDRGVIDHAGLQVDAGALIAIRERAKADGALVINAREDELFDFVDRFGAEWELDTRSFDDPRAIVEMKRRRALEGRA